MKTIATLIALIVIIITIFAHWATMIWETPFARQILWEACISAMLKGTRLFTRKWPAPSELGLFPGRAIFWLQEAGIK